LGLARAARAATPAQAQDNTAARIEALEQRVSRLESLTAHEEDRAPELVSLSGWSSAFKQGELSKSYKISYTLKSHCEKPIKMLDGSLDFYEPDGKRIYGIPLAREARLDPAGEETFTGNYFLNPARPEEARLRDLPPAQVTTRLHLHRIVFRDNTVLPLE
jgi:hypothetical protein